MNPVIRSLGEFVRGAGFALVLLVVLLAVNLMLNPARFHPAAWGTLIGLAAPLIGAAVGARDLFLLPSVVSAFNVAPYVVLVLALLHISETPRP